MALMGRAIFLLLFLSASVLKAEEKAPSLVEAKADFTKADRELNESWTAAKKSLEPDMWAEILQTQRKWLEFRDDRAELATGDSADKEKVQNSPAYFTTAADLTKERSKFLRGVIAQRDTVLTGQWDDGFGGTVELVAKDSHVFFVFHVVRGHTADLGALAGFAAWNDRIGWFSDKGRKADKPDETNVCFIRRAWKLEVISANAGYYLGKRAFFDGNYYKVASLDAKEEVKIIQAGESGEVPKD